MRLAKWQQAVLFVVGLSGAVFMLVAPAVNPAIEINPTVALMFSGIMGFILMGSKDRDEERRERERAEAEADQDEVSGEGGRRG